MNRLARYSFRDDHGHPLENCVEYRAIFSSHAAEVARLTEDNDAQEKLLKEAVATSRAQAENFFKMKHRAEKAEADRDSAVAAKERAEGLLSHVKRYHEWAKDNCLWHIEANAQVGLYQMINDMEAYFSTVGRATAQDAKPDHPGDASKMVSDCAACVHAPDTCDRAECPHWGPETQEQIMVREANRPLTDEEHAIVDAGYERGKAILAEVRAEDRERRLEDCLKEILNYTGGADNALEDEYVMDRARAALAKAQGGEG